MPFNFGRSGAGRRHVLPRHLPKDLIHIPSQETAMATQGDQAGQKALARPPAHGLGRHMQHSCHLARCQILAFVCVDHGILDRSCQLSALPCPSGECPLTLDGSPNTHKSYEAVTTDIIARDGAPVVRPRRSLSGLIGMADLG